MTRHRAGTGSRVRPGIPSSQAYYWTAEWQREERKAVEEIESGDFVRFSDSKEAVRWLRETPPRGIG